MAPHRFLDDVPVVVDFVFDGDERRVGARHRVRDRQVDDLALEGLRFLEPSLY